MELGVAMLLVRDDIEAEISISESSQAYLV